MLTEKDYCDYETCVSLEELGYPRYSYDNGGELDKILRMVTLYNAQKWLREEKLLHIVIDKLLHGAYEFSVVDILNYSEEKMVQLILTKKLFPKVLRRLLKY